MSVTLFSTRADDGGGGFLAHVDRGSTRGSMTTGHDVTDVVS
jgi:hypothetical protein